MEDWRSIKYTANPTGDVYKLNSQDSFQPAAPHPIVQRKGQRRITFTIYLRSFTSKFTPWRLK